MKVVLLQDVAKIGHRHTVVDVPTGYAQNMLIPKRMAVPATPLNLKKAAATHEATALAGASAAAAFEAARVQLAATSVTIVAEANDKDHLFKAVHESDIVSAAADQGIRFEGSMLTIAEPIKSVGDHTVTLTCQDKHFTFTVTVVKK